jgi:NAD(P)-dependent dehydrogenase (short-subunit alcohol dehydrogenase family)
VIASYITLPRYIHGDGINGDPTCKFSRFTLLLLPIMRGGTGKKIVVTGSGIHKTVTEMPQGGLEVLNSESYYRRNTPSDVYAATKLLGNYVVRELAKLVPAEKVTVVNVCPGLVKSELRREGANAALTFVAWTFGRTIEEG